MTDREEMIVAFARAWANAAHRRAGEHEEADDFPQQCAAIGAAGILEAFAASVERGEHLKPAHAD